MSNRTTRRLMAVGISWMSVALIPLDSFADSLNLTTWYPAPYGVYSQLRSTGNSYFAYQGGSVGIGTASPGTAKLKIEGSDAVQIYTQVLNAGGGIAYTNWGLGTSPVSALAGINKNTTGNIFVGASPYAAVFGNQSNNPTQFATNNTVQMTIDPSGNVGIGTTNPIRTLQIAKSDPGNLLAAEVLNTDNTNPSSHAALRLITGGANAGDPLIQFGIIGGGLNNYAMGIDNSDGGKFKISYAFSNTPWLGVNDRLTLDASGNVGIGTTIPAAKLQVGSSGDGSVALANAWNTFSSRRFKENVRPIGGALDKISRLRGVEFRWKGSGKRDLGVVAEEVGQVFPEIVDYETGGRDARGLDYSKLVAPLIEAVKEQQQQIKTQSARIEALEKTLAEVRRK